MRLQFVYLAGLVVFPVLMSGCDTGTTGGTKTYPAGGVVKFSDGQPIGGATISLVSAQNDVARAVSDSEGKFQLGTFKETDGAVAGKHRVAVEPPIYRGGAPASGSGEVPMRYRTADASGIEVEIKPDGENQLEIVVQRS
jgi:hypothetical protein